MNYNKKTVKDMDVRSRKVLLRCDFNVPQDKQTGEITSDKRIEASSLAKPGSFFSSRGSKRRFSSSMICPG